MLRSKEEIKTEREKWENALGEGNDEIWEAIIDTLNWVLGDAQDLSQYEEV